MTVVEMCVRINIRKRNTATGLSAVALCTHTSDTKTANSVRTKLWCYSCWCWVQRGKANENQNNSLVFRKALATTSSVQLAEDKF